MPQMHGYLPWIAAMAIVLSISARYGLQWSWSKLFLDEETMNLGLIIMMLFSGPQIRMVLLGCLSIWAFLECCHWGASILAKNPNATGVVLLKPLIDLGNLYRVEIVQVKSHIEVFIGLISMFMVLASKCAPIFPVFYWQYLRVKYVVNYLTKDSFTQLDTQLLKRLVPDPLYPLLVGRAKQALHYFVNYADEGDAAR